MITIQCRWLPNLHQSWDPLLILWEPEFAAWEWESKPRVSATVVHAAILKQCEPRIHNNGHPEPQWWSLIDTNWRQTITEGKFPKLFVSHSFSRTGFRFQGLKPSVFWDAYRLLASEGSLLHHHNKLRVILFTFSKNGRFYVYVCRVEPNVTRRD